MTERTFKHVYILGAGFSYAMGGPLFTELLTEQLSVRCANLDQSWRDKLTHHQREMYSNIPTMYEKLSKTSDSPIFRGSYPGMNVEQFLERCDAAACGKQPKFADEILRNLSSIEVYLEPFRQKNDLSVPMREFVNVLKLRLAIETSVFLTEHIDQSERWQPYIDWFSRLDNHDVIITTNYDRLIEETAAKKYKDGGYPAVGKGRSVTDYFASMKGCEDCPVLCKLHGSVDWILRDGKGFMQGPGDPFPDWENELLLGVPGSSKIDLELGILKEIWDHAFDAIADADFISIVGYSMPETDNRLRKRLLNSIAKNCTNLKEINIVLGRKSERGERAKMILEQAVRSRSDDQLSRENKPNGARGVKRAHVNLLPIYAQDFLPRFIPRTEDDYHRMKFVEHKD